MRALLAAVLEAATEAGERILAVAPRDFSVQKKPDDSPVTAADMAAHQALTLSLPRLLPGVPVISEESGEPAAVMLAVAMTASRYWLVDPLDGTRDFLAGNGDYTVNVALMEDGVPVLGCLVAPARGWRFGAARGLGAFDYAKSGACTRLAARSTVARLATCLVSRFHQGGEVEALARHYPGLVSMPMGSSLKYGVIARGDADFTVRRSPTMLWDTAAAQALLEEAGGAMLGPDAKPLAYRTGSLVNPPFFARGAEQGLDYALLADIIARRV